MDPSWAKNMLLPFPFRFIGTLEPSINHQAEQIERTTNQEVLTSQARRKSSF